MESTITIEGKQFGRGRALFPSWPMPLPPEPGESGPTLRDLIARVVREEVGAFNDRQEARLLVRALTEREIAAGAERGKIDMGGRDAGGATHASPLQEEQAAVDSALLAFEDGLYYVFVDDEQALALDAPVRLRADSRVTFLRLVALAGG